MVEDKRSLGGDVSPIQRGSCGASTRSTGIPQRQPSGSPAFTTVSACWEPIEPTKETIQGIIPLV